MLIRQKKFSDIYGHKHKSKFKKKYQNPFIRRPKKKSFNLSFKKLIVLTIVSTFFIFLVWLCIYSSLFKIKNIIINGTGPINKNELLDYVWSETSKGKIWPQNNLWIFNSSKIVLDLKKEYYLKNIKINKKYLSTLEITFEKKDYAIIWSEDNKYFYVDSDGDIVSGIDPKNIKKGEYVFIENISTNKISNNKISLEPANIDFAIKLFKELSDKKFSMVINKFFVDNEINVIKIKIDAGPEVYFNTKDDLYSQTANLLDIKNVRMKNNFNKLKYIDIRNGDKIYYRN